jgi:hypothetical protein
MSNESTINFVFVSRLNDGAAEIRIETNSRVALQDALLSLGLASASQFAEPKQESKPETTQESAAKKTRATKATKAEVQDVVVKEEAKTEAAPEAAPEVATNVAEEVEQAAPAAAATVEDAAAAVRAYGAKHGLPAARELLQSFGFARTTEVTADKAAAVIAAAAL